jgi:DNA-binding transcriptional LysR family regulator
MHISIRQLFTLDAIVKKGSFKAAAEILHRSHPSIMAAVKKLEEELGFDVFDRSGYRVALTQRGNEFYRATQPVLEQYSHLNNKVEMLQSGSEQHLKIVVGDVTPPLLVTEVLKSFSSVYPDIQLDLYTENLMGPQERLFDDEADIIFHHVDQFDARIEVVPLTKVTIVPVAAPNYLQCRVNGETRYDALKDAVQCVIRCTATHSPTRDYFVVNESPKLTVGDQLSKKLLILAGMAWGHMPDYLVQDELEKGLLVSIAGKNIKEETLDIVAARRAGSMHGATAQLFWELLKQKQPAQPETGVVQLVSRRQQTHEIV